MLLNNNFYHLVLRILHQYLIEVEWVYCPHKKSLKCMCKSNHKCTYAPNNVIMFYFALFLSDKKTLFFFSDPACLSINGDLKCFVADMNCTER